MAGRMLKIEGRVFPGQKQGAPRAEKSCDVFGMATRLALLERWGKMPKTLGGIDRVSPIVNSLPTAIEDDKGVEYLSEQ